MLLEDFRPRSTLVNHVTLVDKPRFPVIDSHNHLGGDFGGWTERPLPELLDRMDQAGVHALVDLDGGWGDDIFYSHLDFLKGQKPDRFRVFCGVNWSAWEEQGDTFGEWTAHHLREQAKRGADGLKVWKNLGLHVKDHNGSLVAVDDARLDPLWAAAGELKLPVIIHVADPVAFFQPLDQNNERWEELQAHPDWHFPSPPYLSFLSIVEGMGRVVERHPRTTFIGAHVGCYAENLAWVGSLLDRCPNFYVDISARTGELGRQPYSARNFFLRYAHRILFGSDAGPDVASYRLYYRFLETRDEYFNYNTGEVPGQGRWYVSGLSLPESVLHQVYYANAARLFSFHEDF